MSSIEDALQKALGTHELKGKTHRRLLDLCREFVLLGVRPEDGARRAVITLGHLSEGEINPEGRLLVERQRRALDLLAFLRNEVPQSSEVLEWFARTETLFWRPEKQSDLWDRQVAETVNDEELSSPLTWLAAILTDTYLWAKLFGIKDGLMWRANDAFSASLGLWAEGVLENGSAGWAGLLARLQLRFEGGAGGGSSASEIFVPEQLSLPLCLLAHNINERTVESHAFLLTLYSWINALSEPLQQELVRTFAAAPAFYLRAVLAAAHAVPSYTIGGSSDGAVDRAAMLPRLPVVLDFIHWVWLANRERARRLASDLALFLEPQPELEPLPAEAFYNDGISSCDALLRRELRSSLLRLTDETPYGLNKRHSYVLDAAAKQWWLTIRNEIAMHEQIRRRLPLAALGSNAFFVMRVRRGELVHDTLQRLTSVSEPWQLRLPMKVVFDDEAGVDEGGLTKEFFQLVVEQLFNVDFGMFVYDEEQRFFWFSPFSFETALQFDLVGTLLGLAIYNNVILDVHFPTVLYKKLLDLPVGYADLCQMQPAVAASLRRLMLMAPEELAALELTFSAERVVFGERLEQPLSPDFAMDLPVTVENRADYVRLYTEWTLTHSIEKQFRPFYQGFWRCCRGTFVEDCPLSAEELLYLVCGSPVLDFHGWEANASYVDGYTADSETVLHFWRWVGTLSEPRLKQLLTFITGSDRAPVKGLGCLPLHIGRSANTAHIPSAHTCFNYLLLPDYKDYEELARKMALALENCQGFGLR